MFISGFLSNFLASVIRTSRIRLLTDQPVTAFNFRYSCILLVLKCASIRSFDKLVKLKKDNLESF